jgi:hypothetical protein
MHNGLFQVPASAEAHCGHADWQGLGSGTLATGQAPVAHRQAS